MWGVNGQMQLTIHSELNDRSYRCLFDRVSAQQPDTHARTGWADASISLERTARMVAQEDAAEEEALWKHCKGRQPQQQ